MEAVATAELEPPRDETLPSRLIAGLSEYYTASDNRGMPRQWQRFETHLGSINGQRDSTCYGVLSGFGGGTQDNQGIDYLTGVEVSGAAVMPDGFSMIEIPAGTYQVFEHGGHISTIQRTWHAIWQQWIPQSGQQLSGSTIMFERYGEEFDPASGLGIVEIWIPQS